MRYNNCKCKGCCNGIDGIVPIVDDVAIGGCVRRHLEPMLVARIYNQPIVEELPHCDMSLMVENIAHIKSAYNEQRPCCD